MSQRSSLAKDGLIESVILNSVLESMDSSNTIARQHGLIGHYGIGGVPWPRGQEGIQASLSYIDLKSRWQPYSIEVCQDLSAARDYLAACRADRSNCYLLTLSDLVVDTSAVGYDFGNLNGGYSLIETEVIHRTRFSQFGA